MEILKELEKHIVFLNVDTNNYDINFVDYSNFSDTKDVHDIDIYKKSGELYKDFDESKIFKELIDKILIMCEKNDINKSEKFIFIEDTNEITNESEIDLETLNQRKIAIAIYKASTEIAVSSRIGPANNILISEKNYNKYNLKEYFNSTNFNFLFDDSIKDIIVFRKNSYVDQSGLVFIYNKNENKYELIELGYYPEKQFIKITLQ